VFSFIVTPQSSLLLLEMEYLVSSQLDKDTGRGEKRKFQGREEGEFRIIGFSV